MGSLWKFYHRCIYGQDPPTKFWRSSISGVLIRTLQNPEWICLGGSLILLLLLFFLPTSTKPQAWKLRESIMAATVAHSAIIVFWKDTAFPCWRAMDRRWKRNVVSLESSVITAVVRRPISCTNSMAVVCHAPAVSMAIGQKMWVLVSVPYFDIFCCALWLFLTVLCCPVLSCLYLFPQ